MGTPERRRGGITQLLSGANWFPYALGEVIMKFLILCMVCLVSLSFISPTLGWADWCTDAGGVLHNGYCFFATSYSQSCNQRCQETTATSPDNDGTCTSLGTTSSADCNTLITNLGLAPTSTWSMNTSSIPRCSFRGFGSRTYINYGSCDLDYTHASYRFACACTNPTQVELVPKQANIISQNACWQTYL